VSSPRCSENAIRTRSLLREPKPPQSKRSRTAKVEVLPGPSLIEPSSTLERTARSSVFKERAKPWGACPELSRRRTGKRSQSPPARTPTGRVS